MVLKDLSIFSSFLAKFALSEKLKQLTVVVVGWFAYEFGQISNFWKKNFKVKSLWQIFFNLASNLDSTYIFNNILN